MVLPRRGGARGTAVRTAGPHTRDGGTDPAELADLVHAERPEAVALVEAGKSDRSRLVRHPGPAGYRWSGTMTDPHGPDMENSLVGVAPAMGGVRVIHFAVGDVPVARAAGGGPGAQRLIVFHAAAPEPDLVPTWQKEVTEVRAGDRPGSGDR